MTKEFDCPVAPVSTELPTPNLHEILITGLFIPCMDAIALTAPHILNGSTRVTVQFSESIGIHAVSDRESHSGPYGMAIRFHAQGHTSVDLITQYTAGFSASTAKEYRDFLEACSNCGSSALRSGRTESLLAAHPSGFCFGQIPQPIPCSFTLERFVSVNSYQFMNQHGVTSYGRYLIVPWFDSEYPANKDVCFASAGFLIKEIRDQVAAGPVKLRILVQLVRVTSRITRQYGGRTIIECGSNSVRLR